MPFRDTILGQPRPSSVGSIELPRRVQLFPSPADWRDEVLYFLLPDRFSDGLEAGRPLLDRTNLPAARPSFFRFDRWAQGGGERWQGGTVRGITSKIDYLKGLGVTCLWVGPVFKQRGHLDTYHAYAIQDFLEVDAHFGTRNDLVDLVDAAHAQGLRVILDIIFNHSGHNWDYVAGENPPFKPWPGFYYGTEQSFAGPEKALRDQFLPDYNAGNPPPDRYLREAMFGPEHPRLGGRAGLQAGAAGLDTALPGFGPFGTSGHHCFDPGARAYVRIAALIAVRKAFPVLRYGRQYLRQISNFGAPFAFPAGGELIAWSRILDDEEALCVVNGHGNAARGGQIVVDSSLNRGPSAFFEVVANSAQAASSGLAGTHPVGQHLPVQFRDGTAFVQIETLSPSEVLVLVNRP